MVNKFLKGEVTMMKAKIEANTYQKFISEIQDFYPKKTFGYFFSKEDEEIATDYYIFSEDSRKEENVMERFNKFGKYYENNLNAGFLSSIQESVAIEKYIIKNKLKKIGVFHTHLRHPPIFTKVDAEFHPSENFWHLIISLRNAQKPTIKIFEILSNVNFNEIPVILCDQSRNIVSIKGYGRQKVLNSSLLKMSINNQISDCFTIEDFAKCGELFISKTMITNEQYKRVFKNHQYNIGEEKFPVVNITWYEAQYFCEVTDTELLTKEEWELYADDQLDPFDYEHHNEAFMKVALYSENSKNQLQQVATLKPNQYGLYDMQGNAWEWCACFESKTEVANTKGGSYFAFPEMCRKTVDQLEDKDYFARDLGFRVKRRNV
ncbi:hypothetical protein ATZ35_15200 [Enterococcus rotai]|uniref:Sulfatase-modifying factor enzyme-like domain-containing protein n=2 Tax=Enterococcus rotai TaxID=118060 RepID=A0A0U2XMH2_9ENTE|nr:hypothetical protein ATZ35_15200 [Enterococcus rotai]